MTIHFHHIRLSRKLMLLAGGAACFVLGLGAVAALHTMNTPQKTPPPGPVAIPALSEPGVTFNDVGVPGKTFVTTPGPTGNASGGGAANSSNGRAGGSGGGVVGAPSQLFSLANWKLTLPTDSNHDNKVDEVVQPQLASLSIVPYFYLNEAKNGIIFQANAGGKTTSGSSYPRSELREMSGSQLASWSNTSGTHTMTIQQAITHLPAAKPDVVAGQIHDSSDDVIEIRLEGSRLYVESDGKSVGDLDPNYKLGSVFPVKVVAANGHIKVYYNDGLKVDYARASSGLYFKAGCYTQSNTTKGDSADAYGQVVIYGLQVSHS